MRLYPRKRNRGAQGAQVRTFRGELRTVKVLGFLHINGRGGLHDLWDVSKEAGCD